MFEKGKLVTVYEDPVTQKKTEGNAKIVRYVTPAGADGLGLYAVNFIGDDPTLVVTRYIDERPYERKWTMEEEVLEREG